MSILAIDYGKKRLGIAVSYGFIPTPLESISFDKIKIITEKISEIVKEYDVREIVIGLPLNMDGTESEMTKEVRCFANKIEKAFDIVVALVDERLTSKDAESKLSLTTKSWRKRKKKIDSVSACLILENYINRAS